MKRSPQSLGEGLAAKRTAHQEAALRAIAAANERDLQWIAERMGAAKTHIRLTEMDNRDSHTRGQLPRWRAPDGANLSANHGVETLMTGPDREIPYGEYSNACQHSHMAELLGRSCHHALLMNTNLETRTFKYVRDNLPHILEGVPVFLGANRELRLLPAQRLRIGLHAVAYPFDVDVSLRWLSPHPIHQKDDEILIRRLPFHVPRLEICSLGTATGKTLTTIASVMLQVATKERFASHLADKCKRDSLTQTMGHNGFAEARLLPTPPFPRTPARPPTRAHSPAQPGVHNARVGANDEGRPRAGPTATPLAARVARSHKRLRTRKRTRTRRYPRCSCASGYPPPKWSPPGSARIRASARSFSFGRGAACCRRSRSGTAWS